MIIFTQGHVRRNPLLLKLMVRVVIENVHILGICGIKEEW